MNRPAGMEDWAWAAIRKLRADVRDRVLERSAIVWFGGGVAKTPAEADAIALAQEAGIHRELPGVG
jgi:hypothetical protein